MRSETLGFNFYLKQWLTKGKRGDKGDTKIWVSWEQKKLLDEIKSIFF